MCMTGLVWMTKIITDPFHDVYLYHKAPCTCCAASCWTRWPTPASSTEAAASV
jgi:hypothetical protein